MLLKENALKAEVDKVEINKLTNISTSLNNLKTKVNYLDVDKLKTVPVDMEKLSDVVGNEVVKKTKFNTIKAKVNNLENKIPDATTLIHINQYNTLKQNLVNKTDLDNKLTRFNIQITSYKTKYLEVQGKLNSQTTRDYIFLLGKVHFTSNDGSQSTFIYQPTLDVLELKKRQR